MRLMFLTLLLTGCSAPIAMIPPQKPSRPVLAEPMHLVNPAPTTIVIGESVQGRPIEMQIFPGDARDCVLIIGGIHGNEQISVDVASALAGLLRHDPSLARGRQVYIIPNANPDGYAKNTRANARGIDLNRNFEARNFKPSARSRGVMPLSEPEARALATVIQQVHPSLLISIHSIDKGRHCNNYDGPAREIAQLMTRYNGYPAKDTIGYPTPGSLGSWVGGDLHIPMITLELPRGITGMQAWLDNREALLAAIAAGS